ncbi:STAS domain-containing protein [Bailinhaonella thermotolerans]|uniref:Anti-sigma factor antagonist n=1 Tax=Bailinhaonella thermotolerans TaxID=1070861 RepID=A0A3A4A763_9ACTN|nr:STAS domain-containing protein [Bailinhaonella thermotolerans]RJL24796.1 anti-sigma factor antagonist [Bailinhaonella thermotolerans]
MAFRVSSSRLGDCVVIWSTGTLDKEACLDLATEIASAWQPGLPLVFDMSQAEFPDASVIPVLLSAQERSKLTGIPVALVGVDPRVQRVLYTMALDPQFMIFPTLEAAATALQGYAQRPEREIPRPARRDTRP